MLAQLAAGAFFYFVICTTLSREDPSHPMAPMSVCTAMSQGYIGYDLQNALREELLNRGIHKSVATILTQVEVDPNDPAFQNPTKPIGTFMTEAEAEEMRRRGNTVMEDAGRGWRRCVASPLPKAIVEIDTIRALLAAGQIAVACGVPTTPGTTEPLKSREAAQKLAMEFGFPVILKAAAGGGGRGMRRCDTVEEVGTNFDLVKAEAKKAFGNDDIFMEKFLVEPKHIEVQVLGDEEGNVVHLFERDCSLQRRYQKVVEFRPPHSPWTRRSVRPCMKTR